MQLRPQMAAEMRPKRIEFGYLSSNSKEAMNNDFNFFDSHLDSGQAVLPCNSVADRIAAVEFVEV